jgi:hypothetical protein
MTSLLFSQEKHLDLYGYVSLNFSFFFTFFFTFLGLLLLLNVSNLSLKNTNIMTIKKTYLYL